MKFRYIILLLFSLFLCTACEKEKVVVRGGHFDFRGTSYPVKHLRFDHIGYLEDDCVLRMTAYPATYKYDKVNSKGYGAVVQGLLLSDQPYICQKCDYKMLNNFDTIYSSIVFYPDLSDKSSILDTTIYTLTSGILTVDTVDGTSKFDFKFFSQEGDTLNGYFLDDYVYNFEVDQTSYGSLAFDTISCNLATPTMWHWGKLFSENLNYFEFVFYSTDARFSDKGNLKSGIQLVVGLNDFQELYPSVSNFPVSFSPDQSKSAFYGHKVNNTSWGTYWQVYESGSAIGKANIIADSARVVSIDDYNINMHFKFKDQLGNVVEGRYDGPYLTKYFK